MCVFYDVDVQPLYRDLVTAINNADTLITLVVPSTIIVVCNVRISIALSRFYRSIAVTGRRMSLTANSSLCAMNQTPRRHRRAVVDWRRSWAAQSNVTIYSNSSYNRLQMKVSFSLSSVFAISQCNNFELIVFVITLYSAKAIIVPHRIIMKLVHWPLMSGLLAVPTTKCNSPPINGQCTNHRIAV